MKGTKTKSIDMQWNVSGWRFFMVDGCVVYVQILTTAKQLKEVMNGKHKENLYSATFRGQCTKF